MPGPLPKPAEQKRRRNASPSSVRLPRSGRPGDAPVWPLGLASPSEAGVWDELWGSPQAIAWEKLGLERIVARYVRVLVAAEADLTINLLTEARHLEDKLGLHPAALARLRWEIVEDEGDAGPASVSALDDYRAMMKRDG